MWTWPNIIRAVAIILLIGLGVFDYGLDWMAKPPPKELYILLLAIALGVDIKGIRDIFLRMLGGGKGDQK